MSDPSYNRRQMQVRAVPVDINDEAQLDDAVPADSFDISSFGADYDVEGLISRLRRGDIFIPTFQRNYVWNQKEASRFIESLLLGLPVPGVFLAREPESQQLLVIDGQQRLLTLLFFVDGYFHPNITGTTRRVFNLQGVSKRLENRTFQSLEDRDRRKLMDSIIHATIVKQDSPADDDTSIYHIFERLNTAGRKLTAQEIRTAIYHGPLINLLEELNQLEAWRSIMGKPNVRLKDEELILRFLALFHQGDAYERPMEEFLTKFLRKNMRPAQSIISQYREEFTKTITVVADAIGKRAFRPIRAVNAAVLDSVMVGIARRLNDKSIENEKFPQVLAAYTGLLENREFRDLITQSTSDELNVRRRLELATEAFANL
jgi:hypothetical protein